MTAARCKTCGVLDRRVSGAVCLATGKPRDPEEAQCMDGDQKRRAKAVRQLTTAMGRGRRPKTGRW